MMGYVKNYWILLDMVTKSLGLLSAWKKTEPLLKSRQRIPIKMPKSIYIRNFHWDDLKETITFTNKVNNNDKTPRELTESLFVQSTQILGFCVQSDFFVAFNAAKSMVGFMKIIKEPKISRHILEYSITNNQDRVEVFGSLINKAHTYIRKTNLKSIHIQVDSNDLKIIEFLKTQHYSKIKTYWTYIWKTKPLEEMNVPDGFCLTHFVKSKDEAPLTSLQNQSFETHWGFAPNSLEEISARVSMERNYPKGIIILKDRGRFAGYNWTQIARKCDQSVGWISMIGIHPDYRGRKLGKAIVLAGMHQLNNIGASEIELEVDSDNKPATNLYLALGFIEKSTTFWFERNNQPMN